MNRQQMILQLVKFLLYSIFRWLFGALQRTWWLLNGTCYYIWQNSNEEVVKDSSISAQILNIHWRYRYSEILRPNSLTDFVYSHSHFDHPAIVLRDAMTLYTICDTEAVFVEAEHGIDVANSSVSSFMKVAQFQHATRLVVIPIRTFHCLAEEMGGPHGRLFFVNNSGRCGSTLLCRIFEETQKWIAFAEPDALNILSNMDTSRPDFDKMVRSTMRMLCKSRKSEPEGYMIKISAPATLNLLRPLYRIFPLAHYAYMYRDGIKVAQSMTKLREQDPLLKLLDTTLTLFPWLQNHAIRAGGFESPDFISVPMVDSLPRYFLIWAILSSKFVEFQEAGIPCNRGHQIRGPGGQPYTRHPCRPGVCLLEEGKLSRAAAAAGT